MASLNKVLLMGNLTRDPRVSSSGSGSVVCEFSIAVNRRYSVNGQERDEVCYIDIVVWGRQADACGKYLQKGSAVFVEGRLKTDAWEDKEGKKRSRLRVSADRVQFLTSRGDSSRVQQPSHEEYVEEEPESFNPVRKDVEESTTFRNEKPMPMPSEDIFKGEAEHEDDIPF